MTSTVERGPIVVGPITRSDIVRYAGAGGDFNPVHHDEPYAQSLGLPGVFAMGLLGAGYLSRVLTEEFGVHAVRTFAVRFRAQMWPGETLELGVDEVLEADDDGDPRERVVLLSARNQQGELKISAEARVRVGRPAHPAPTAQEDA